MMMGTNLDLQQHTAMTMMRATRMRAPRPAQTPMIKAEGERNYVNGF